MEWDAEVDVVCAGAGAAGLAHAIAIDDLGGDVFVTESRNGADGSWLIRDVEDASTKHFFAEVASDVRPLPQPSHDVGVPIRVAPSRASAETGRSVAPFVGARLREWAAQCLATPFGFLSTRLPDSHATTVQTADGRLLEMYEIGTLTADSGDLAGTVFDWLSAGVVERDIDVHIDHALQRLVFEEDVAVGAVFTTPDGPLAVRARLGVTVANGAARPPKDGRRTASDNPLSVCLVGQRASRFGRVELITAESLAVPLSAACHASNRRLHGNLRETYHHSMPWGCRKLHGYPPLDE